MGYEADYDAPFAGQPVRQAVRAVDEIGECPMKRQKILVVDADKGTARYVLDQLEKAGYELLAVHSGEAALQAIRQEKPDLVVLELMLSDPDGLAIIRLIRNDPWLFRLPIVILTAQAQEADIVGGLTAGADDYITKPFDPRDQLARVRAVLRRSYQADASRKALSSPIKQ